MGRLILPAILLLPLIEIAGFVWIGGLLGIWGTLLWTLMAALIGLRLLSRESVGAMRRAETSLRGGRSPAIPVVDAGLSALAGVLLLVPGFFTDAVGLLLALRPVRLWIAARAAGRFGLARARRNGPSVVELEAGEYQDLTPSEPTSPEPATRPMPHARRDDTPWRPR